MKASFNMWLAGKYDLPGVLAASVIYPDKTSLAQIFSKSLAGKALEKTWQNVAEMSASLAKLNMAAPCLRWLFGDAWVYGSAREDGICLAIITVKGLSREESEAVENLIVEFQNI